MKTTRREFLSTPGVAGVHELHAWTLSSGFHALSAHLLVPDPGRQQAALKAAAALAAREYGIRHSVFQVEGELTANSSCDTCAR